MTVHMLMMPDPKKGDSLAAMHWDDEAGTIGGEHSDVPVIRQLFDAPTPYFFGSAAASWDLHDPAHSIEEMNIILRARYQNLVDNFEDGLPPPFKNLEPRRPDGREELYDDDGNLMT